METHVTVKGQIVIPAELRRKYGIMAGTKVSSSMSEGLSCLSLSPKRLQSLQGSLKGKGMFKGLARGTRRDAERD